MFFAHVAYFLFCVVFQHLGKEGMTFCIELCARALQTDLKNDPVTKSLIYKTIAYLFPNDLEICRACALLVFFLERTVEAYKTVFFLYNHPDLEYHLDTSPVGNNVRFEVIQILKKDLFFDPEFWSLLNIKTNCLKLMSDEVARAALCEIMEEDKWTPSYCIREHCKCHAEPERTMEQEAKPDSRDGQESEMVEKQVTSPSGEAFPESPQYKRRGRKPGTRLTKNLEPFPVRRSFRQLDLAQNHARQLSNRCQRFLTRQAEKNILKRRGRKPRWLLEQLAALGENSAPGQRKKPGRKPKLFSSLKDILVDTPVIEITMEYSYPDNEVELPADIQGRFTSKTTSSTEHRFDRPQTAPPNSLLQTLLEKCPQSWIDKEDFQSQEVVVVIRKFHTYAKVPEEEESPTLDRLTDASVLTAQNAVKQEDDFQSPVSVKNPSEPVEGTKVASLTAPVTQEIPGVRDGSDLPLLSPVEQAVVPDGKITTTVSPPKDHTVSAMTENIQALENTQEVSNLGNTPDKATDYIHTMSEKGTDIISTSENAPNTTPELAPQNRISTPIEILDTHENQPEVKEATDDSKKAPAAGIILKTPTAFEETKPQEPTLQQTGKVEPSQKSGSSPVSGAQTTVQPKHRCKLCNKKYETLLTHALWHYRTEKKCMFCDKLAMTRGALQHFQKHIKDLSRVEIPLETKKCEDVPETTGSPDQTAHESPPKKAKPGFAQIKSRLLMRLKLTRKAQPQCETEKSPDNSETPVKETDTKKHTSATEQKESSSMDDKPSVPQETIRYLTRGSVRKSEHKGRLLRKKLDRKGKTRRLMSREDSSAPKDGSVHRVNGVTRKKQKMCLQEESSFGTDKNVPPVKEENKTEAEKSEKTVRSHKANYDIRTKAGKASSNNFAGESKNCAKAKVLEEHRVKKKKHRDDEEKAEVKSAKKRKNEESTSTAKSADTTEEKNSIPSAEKQQNGTGAESSETSEKVRKRKVSSTPVVSCPIDTCTFQAMPGPVLSHVLIHHPCDTKALEFFYNFAAKKCLFCARRIWTPQHFFDHVVSHRGNLKHPCYQVACQKRFKTRMDVGDHMEKDHHPLKARCCFPGCTVESASLKDLYSHEKSHYKAVMLKRDNSLTPENVMDKPSSKAARVKSTLAAAQQTAESVVTELEAPPLPLVPPPSSPPPPSPPPPPPIENKQQKKSPAPVKPEDEKPLILNRSSVNYSSKSSQLVNGHTDHAQEPSVKGPPTALKEPEPKYEKVAVKPFSRLPPSAYLDELYLSMPKKWRGPQVSTKGSDKDDVIPVKRQSCSRCNAAFDCEEELQLHREKCTSLFGFDSDDESKHSLQTL